MYKRQTKDYIDHRGGRLEDLKTLSSKSPEWNAALQPATEYVQESQKVEKQRRNKSRGLIFMVMALLLGFFGFAYMQQIKSAKDQGRALVASIENYNSFLPTVHEMMGSKFSANLYLEALNHDQKLPVKLGENRSKLSRFYDIDRRLKFAGEGMFGRVDVTANNQYLYGISAVSYTHLTLPTICSV